MTENSVSKIAVFGAGIMGRGIAQAFLMGGYEVSLLSRTDRTLDAAKRHISESLEKMKARDLVSDPKERLSRLSLTRDRAEALEGAILLSEAIEEDLEVKRGVFLEAERLAGKETVFATNASHLDPEAIFEPLATRYRCLIAHWFNPAQLIPLVEVAKLSGTDEKYWHVAIDILKRAGKTAVKLKKPVQGLIINRLFSAMAREAIHLLDSGVADPCEMDEAVKASIGIRIFCLGVFKTMDLGDRGSRASL